MRKFLSILLSVAMLITILPASFASAADAAKYSVKMVDSTKGDVMPGDTLTFTWTFNGGYDFLSGFNFVVDYDDDYLTPVENATYPGGKILKPACEVANSQIKGTAVAGDNVWTKEEEEDEETGDIEEKNLALLQVRFTVNENVPANAKSAVVLDITSYCVWDDAEGAIEYPVEVDQIPEFIINPQENVVSSDATLKSLKYGNESVELVSGKFDYAVELEEGSEIPLVTYQVNDEKATASATTVDGVTTITVKAEDGTQKVYTLTITVKEPEKEPTETVEFALTNEFKALLTDAGLKKYSDISLKEGTSKTNVQNVKILSWDEDGYNKAKTYDVTYTPAGGAETTATGIKYADMKAIVSDSSNTVASVKEVKNGFNYDASVVETNVGPLFFTDAAHNVGITGSAWDNSYHVVATREFGVARATSAANFKDGIAPVKNESSAYSQYALNGGYIFTATPDKDATIYYVVPEASAKTKAVLLADGWKNVSNIDAPVPTDGMIKATNAPSAEWWNTDSAYNYEQYPYILTKMQYDTGSTTNSIKYFDVWYIEVERGTVVNIPANARTTNDYDAPKCLVKFEEHKSDDVTGELTVGEQKVSLTSRFNSGLEFGGVNVGDSILVETNDSTAKVELSENVVTKVPSTVEATITAACGNSVKYTIKLMPTMPTITNVAYASGAMSGPYKLRAAEWSRGTASDVSAAISPADFAAIETKYGKMSPTNEFYAGTDMYMQYPQAYASSAVAGYKYVDSPSQVVYGSTSRMFFDKGAYVFKHHKTRANNSDYYYGGVGKYDGTDGKYYLTFDISAAGTMYIVDLEGKGVPNATNEGYKAVSDLKVAGYTKIYAKHYESGQTVKVPSYGWDNNWGYATDARTWYNPSYFVFVFDSERDTTVESVTLGGDTIGSIDMTESQFNYEARVIVKDGGVITFDVKTTDPNAIVEPAEIKATVVDGKANASFKVYSSDMLAEATYNIAISKADDYSVVNGAVDNKNGSTWISGMYTTDASGALSQNKYAVVDDLQIGVTGIYSDRTNKLYGSEMLNGATYIRVPKNQASGSWENITVDENSAFYKDGEDGEWTPATVLSNGSSATTLRKITKSSYQAAQFAESIENWLSFEVTSDCTVVLGDSIKKGYPNLNKDEWVSDTGYWMHAQNSANNENTYVKHFKAGERVVIPSYGVPVDQGLDVVRTYKYTVNGVEQTYTTTVGDDYLNWDNILIAVIWDDKNSNTDIAKIKLNGEAVDATVDGNDYTVVSLDGSEEATLEIVAADPSAKVDAPAVIKSGETVEVTITSVNGKSSTYKVTMLGETRKLSVTVIDGDATMTIGSKVSNIGSSYTGIAAFGAEITLTANGTDGAQFLYWKETDTNRIVSNEAEFTTTLTSDANYVAVCASKDYGYMVTFVNANNAVIAQGYASDLYKVPANPYQLGYVFGGWMTEEGLDAKLAAGDDLPAVEADTTFKAYYAKDETLYKVTVNGTEYEKAYNALVEVKTEAEADGKVFSHWTKNGVVVSYNTEYAFYMPNYNVSLEAVYADVAPEAVATVVMAAPVLVDENRISFFMERNANGAEVLESGILLSSTTTDITLESYELKAKAQQTTSPGQFTVRKANVKAGDTWNAVAYMIYKAADGEIITIYSDAVTYAVKDPADFVPGYDRIEDGGDVL